MRLASFAVRFLPLCAFSAVVAGGVVACSSDTTDTPADDGTKKAVVEQYAKIVHESYHDAGHGAEALQTAVDAFLAAPSEATLNAARAAWVSARPTYGQTEAYRFYGGPIDAEETGPETRINGWPLDEAYIDYVEGDANAGIINKATEFPTITKELIAAQNEKGGEKNLSAGWHAIEFLLWGQDKSDTGPGARPFTDYVVGTGGTAANQERRRTYLKAVTDLLVEDLESLGEPWHTEGDTYGAKFVADPNTSLGNILKGIGSLAAGEVPNERMGNAYKEKDQEEEHSCFSDTTIQDLHANVLGIENVYLGRWGSDDGVGIEDLVKAKDAALNDKTKADLTAALAAIQAIPAPFDQAIKGDDSAPGRVKVKAAMDATAAVAEDIAQIATALGVTINFE